jgi:hypothetical protein
MKKEYIPKVGDLVRITCPFLGGITFGIIIDIGLSDLTRKFIEEDVEDFLKSNLNYRTLNYFVLIPELRNNLIMKTYKISSQSYNSDNLIPFYYDDLEHVQNLDS